MPGGPPSNARLPLSTGLLVFILVAAVLAAYAACLQSGYVEFDDPMYILDNPHIYTGLSWPNIRWAFSAQALSMGIWGPLTWLSHMTDCQLFGLMPLGHHLHSILLHAANAVLLFLLLYRGTGCRWRAFLVAALFALHPLNVENVAWLSERKSLLCMGWSLVAIGAYGWYARRPSLSRYAAVFAAMTLALLAKPMAVTLPAVLLLIDEWPLRRLAGEARAWPSQRLRLLAEKLPLFALSALFSWIAILAERHANAIGSVPAGQRLMNAAVSFVFYIEKMFWPSRLTCFYPFRAAALSPVRSIAAACLLLAVTALVLRLRRRRHLVFGWLLYLGTLVPVIGVMQIGSFARADRYAYLPLIGLLVILVWELEALARRLRLSRWWQGVAVALLLFALGLSTYRQAGYWQDDLTLFQHAHDVTAPPDAYLETDLASALRDRARFREADVYYRSALALDPSVFFTHYNLARNCERLGENDEALSAYRAALTHTHNAELQARALSDIATLCLRTGEREQARQALQDLVALNPANQVWRARLDALEGAGKPAKNP